MPSNGFAGTSGELKLEPVPLDGTSSIVFSNAPHQVLSVLQWIYSSWANGFGVVVTRMCVSLTDGRDQMRIRSTAEPLVALEFEAGKQWMDPSEF